MDIVTQKGLPASLLGLAGNDSMEKSYVPIAFAAGVNYYFFYQLSYNNLLEGLKPLLRDRREEIIVATGSQSRDPSTLRQDLEKVRHYLDLDVVDVFFAEYLSPSDDLEQVRSLLDELQVWKQKGLVRYVGVTTHNRPLARELIESERCEVLMLRYNMAHRKAEEQVLPAAQQAKIPVVAFTCTRWGSLLKGHPDWHDGVPQAADCYRYALRHPAVSLALTAPQTLKQLEENLSVLESPQLSSETEALWHRYGALIYGEGQDAFDTQWP